MNATLWLLIAIVLSLAVIIVLCELATRGAHTPIDEPEYRTADGKAIERQTRKLQARVPATTTRYQSACTGDCNQGRRCSCANALAPADNPIRQAIEQINRPNLRELLKSQADTIESDARDAALLDALHGTNTANPHRYLTRAHAMWAHAYQAQQRNQQQA